MRKYKRLNEDINVPEDWDLEEMALQHGHEFISEMSPDDMLYEMDFIGEIWPEPLEAIRRTYYGGRSGFPNDSFNPNDEYFYVNAYGNAYSVPDYDADTYILDTIKQSGIEEFYEWCVDNGYTDED